MDQMVSRGNDWWSVVAKSVLAGTIELTANEAGSLEALLGD